MYEISKFKPLIKECKNVLLIAHRKPDGDSLGGAIGLYYALKQLNINAVLACLDKPEDKYNFINGLNLFVQDFDINDFDTMFTLDHGDYKMMGLQNKYPILNEKPIRLVNIDHHASNDNFGHINLVDTNASSTTVVVYNLIKELGLNITPDIATALLTGIYTDTGSFMHSNTDLMSLDIASDLIAKGANRKDIVDVLFKTNSVEQLNLWGSILRKTRLLSNGTLISSATEEDFKQSSASNNDVNGAIDFINKVPGARFSVLLHDTSDGKIKGSLRTNNDDVDLNLIASKFGGGGHKKAAGFRINGKLSEDSVVNIIQ